MKILLVDDDEMNLSVLEEMLEDEPFDLIHAENGEEAYQKLESNDDIIIIILDKMMPVLDGNEFVSKIRENEKYQNIPVIMQTAAAAKQDVIEGTHNGIYYYLTKPYEKRVLLSVFHSAIEDCKNKGLLPADFKF